MVNQSNTCTQGHPEKVRGPRKKVKVGSQGHGGFHNFSLGDQKKKKKSHYVLTMTIATSHQLCLLIYKLAGPLKNTVTALLQYLDLDCSIRVYQSFKQVFKEPLMGP